MGHLFSSVGMAKRSKVHVVNDMLLNSRQIRVFLMYLYLKHLIKSNNLDTNSIENKFKVGLSCYALYFGPYTIILNVLSW